MPDLPLHGKHKKHNEIDDEDWRKDWNIQDLKERANDANKHRLGTRVPKFELWKPARKGLELGSVGCRQKWSVSFRVLYW